MYVPTVSYTPILSEDEAEIRAEIKGEIQSEFAVALKEVIAWLRDSRTLHSKSVKIDAIWYYLTNTPQKTLAQGVGVTKAALNHAAIEFRNRFHIESPRSRPPSARALLSKLTKERHERIKSGEAKSN